MNSAFRGMMIHGLCIITADRQPVYHDDDRRAVIAVLYLVIAVFYLVDRGLRHGCWESKVLPGLMALRVGAP